MPLKVHHHVSSEMGLFSVTTLVEGTQACILIDPPFLIPDAESVIEFIKSKTSKPLVAGINREYDEKVKYWPSVFGKENVPSDPSPRKPELPTERTIITGDAVYARSVHAWVEEIETYDVLHAWRLTLKLIGSLNPTTIIPGHIERGWEPDAKKDLEYMHKYLDLFEQKIAKPVFVEGKKKPEVDDLYQTFKKAFPDCEKNLDFFLGKMSNAFGEGGEIWEENCRHPTKDRSKAVLEGFMLEIPKTH
ncbi:hypothetical protein LTR64_004636 [Lithohypha guttulata]|uniref:uncharacterized protein n=1 Tax=Lithohypha guttulata TaxID=1690604 RepID=UPI002DE03BE3|nr:hypothetical protein LTR51_006066 [Lithohypha guttulata]